MSEKAPVIYNGWEVQYCPRSRALSGSTWSYRARKEGSGETWPMYAYGSLIAIQMEIDAANEVERKRAKENV